MSKMHDMNGSRKAPQRGWRKLALYVIAVGLCLPCAGSTRRGVVASPAMVGSYQLEFRGPLAGRGNATVSPTSVTISGIVRDEAGNTGPFVAPNLPLSKGRFSGSATALGLPVQLSGRIDSPGDVLKTARLVCNFDTTKGQYGRVLGFKR